MATRSYSRGINLLNLREGEHDLAAVSCAVVGLARVALEVDSLEVGQRAELRVERAEVRNLVV